MGTAEKSSGRTPRLWQLGPFDDRQREDLVWSPFATREAVGQPCASPRSATGATSMSLPEMFMPRSIFAIMILNDLILLSAQKSSLVMAELFALRRFSCRCGLQQQRCQGVRCLFACPQRLRLDDFAGFGDVTGCQEVPQDTPLLMPDLSGFADPQDSGGPSHGRQQGAHLLALAHLNATEGHREKDNQCDAHPGLHFL